MPKYTNPSGLACSFCHKPQREVDKIIAGPNVYICSECIKLCLDIIRENAQPKPISWGGQKVPIPAKIKSYLDQYVIGQDQAKRKIAVAVYNHYKRLEANQKSEGNGQEGDVEVQKSNVLLIGPTGTGKTLIAQTLARFLDVPFVIADATTLTEAGYVGEDVENIILNLYQASGNNLDRTIRGIVYIDEVDKLAKKSFTSSVSRDVSGEGVQQALLKIIEGTTANIQVRGNKRLPNQEYLQVDTSNILFICGGSFEGLGKIIEERTGKKTVGFMADEEKEERLVDELCVLQSTTSEDLEHFGIIPEFIGRLPVIAIMDDLDEESLVQILSEPKNSLVKQYQKLFRFEKVKLAFTEGALKAVAHRAADRRAGARGLRTILEGVMLDIMYDIPGQDNIREVTITEAVVTEGAEPETEPVRDYGVPS
jgi:ATP-dependent Clp protease ATP-binding subunit ClpX